MDPTRCLYTLVHAEPRHHDEVVRLLVAPVAREVRFDERLDSLFFVRYDEPRWQIRFRLVGQREWVEGPVRRRIEEIVSELEGRGLAEGHDFTEYAREVDRYGGEEGMRLAEELYTRDSFACLDLLDAERNGSLETSRREFDLALADRFLDLLKFDAGQRLAFYERGYRWALETGTWRQEDLAILEERYRVLEPHLRELVLGSRRGDPRAYFGGEEPARIANAFLEAAAPIAEKILAGIAAGRIARDPVYLAWSYTHLMCNRLGIDTTAEAILRYFMHRLLLDRRERDAASDA